MFSVRAAAGLTGSVLILAGGPSEVRAQAFELRGDDLALAVRADAHPAGAPTVESQADLSASFAAFQAGLELGVQAGSGSAGDVVSASPVPLAAAPVDSWTGRRVGVNLSWAPTSAASLALSASSRTREAFYRAPPVGWNGSDLAVAAAEQHMTATAAVEPASRIDLQLGVEALSDRVQSFHPSEPSAPLSTSLDLATQRAFATATWKPASRLSLEAGTAYETIGVAWAGGQDDASAYRYMRPRLSATLAPWSGGQWRFSVEQLVAPLNTANFVSFVQASGGAAGAAFEPDRERRYQANLQQQLPGGASVGLTLTRSDLQSVTELGPAGDSEAPMSIGPGERRRIEISLTSPLEVAGLPATTLTGQASWGASSVTDPVTHALRPISGDLPYQAQFGLTQSLADGRVNLGLTGRLVGEQQYFEPDKVTVLSPTAGLGASVTFSPGPYALRLEANNLVGGDRDSVAQVYLGSRALDVLDHVEQSRNQDRSIRLSLARSF